MQDKKFIYGITDVDGVIFDRMPIYQQAFIRVLKAFGVVEDFAAEFYYNTAGTPIFDQIRDALELRSTNLPDDQIQNQVDLFFRLANREKPSLFPHVRDTLFKIGKKGVQLAATSGSNTKELLALFREHSLPYQFVLGSDRIPKGDQHIKEMAIFFKVEPFYFCKHAFYIGDGPTDMEIARRNKIYAIGITNTVTDEKLISSGANKVIQGIEEVLDIIF